MTQIKITHTSNADMNIGVSKQTAVDWLLDRFLFVGWGIPVEWREQAKQIEKEQMIKFAEFVATYRDKNENYKSEMLHAKSKYDQAERTIDLLEEYYNETYNK